MYISKKEYLVIIYIFIAKSMKVSLRINYRLRDNFISIIFIMSNIILKVKGIRSF